MSLLGDHVYFLVLLFVAKEVSSNNWEIGIVLTLQALPFLLLGPYAGVIADRIDRRKIMILADWFSASITVSLAILAYFVPAPPIWLIASYGFVLSCVNAFFVPARMAALPRLVEPEVLAEANSFFVMMQQVVAMAGVAFAASVLGFIYSLYPDRFLMIGAGLNAATFAFSAYWALKLPRLEPQGEPEDRRSSLSEFMEGLRAVAGDGVLRVVLPTMFVYQFFISGFMVIYIEANKVWFGGDFTRFAWIEFSFAASMALMGLFMGRFKITRPGLSFGLAVGFVGLTVAMMSWAQDFRVFIFWNCLAGLAFPFAWIPIVVYVQSAFDDRLRGRVSGTAMTAQVGSQPFGLLAAGFLLDIVGLSNIFLVVGLGMSIPGFACLLFKSCRDGRATVYAENGSL